MFQALAWEQCCLDMATIHITFKTISWQLSGKRYGMNKRVL